MRPILWLVLGGILVPAGAGIGCGKLPLLFALKGSKPAD